jgi:hypothetical protein
MDLRRSLALLLVAGCAAGSLENNSFGLPATATQPMTTAGDDDDDTGGSTTGDDPSGNSASAEETTAPPTTADDSSAGPADDSTDATDDPSITNPTDDPTNDPTDDPTTDPTDAESTGPVDPSTDDGAMPPPMVGEWENCAQAICDAGNDCIGVVGLDNNDAYCAPQCVSDLDCPLPASGTAEPYCLLVAENEVDPTNCALVCEYDGFDFGTCPNGMQCAAIPDQSPTVSLCMW